MNKSRAKQRLCSIARFPLPLLIGGSAGSPGMLSHQTSLLADTIFLFDMRMWQDGRPPWRMDNHEPGIALGQVGIK
jgi:hypothetical protein